MSSLQVIFPLRLTGELDPDVSRWQWLFKWLLAIPHFVVLSFFWIGFVLSTVVAGFALRWSWRVGFCPALALARRPQLGRPGD